MRLRRALAALVIPLSLVAAIPIGSGVAQAAPTAPTTYAGSTVPSAVSQPTRDKPQSKIWFAGGVWWALMATSTDGQVRIHRLDPDHKWRSTGVLVDSRVNSTADALWTGDELYVASRLNDGIGVRVSSFDFNAQAGTWSLSAGPTTLGTGSVESVTIAQDTVGRVWVTYLRNKRIYVQGTTSTSVRFVGCSDRGERDHGRGVLRRRLCDRLVRQSGRRDVVGPDRPALLLRGPR